MNKIILIVVAFFLPITSVFGAQSYQQQLTDLDDEIVSLTNEIKAEYEIFDLCMTSKPDFVMNEVYGLVLRGKKEKFKLTKAFD